MCIFLFGLADIIFSTLTKNKWKKLNFQKKFKIKEFLVALVLFLPKSCLELFFFYEWFLCTNYIFMFIMKRSIGTRGFKNSASKL